MYAFVDVEQYQIVGTGQTIDEARKNYRTALNLEDVETGGSMDALEKAGTVDAVASVVVSRQYLLLLHPHRKRYGLRRHGDLK